jgi:energy-coupling factor transporter ATP-binding protein EcfA2
MNPANPAITPAIEVRRLSYRYPDGTAALAEVSFAVPPGQSVGLIGPNGAGKSTLLLHLNGILPDDGHIDGEVLIDGQALSPKNLHAIRQKVGLLFQDPDDQLFCPTVFEDVAFGPQQFHISPPRLEQIVKESLTQVGLSGFERRAPHRLSVGEKRRVCLAGVLACQPSVLVLDEPTSDLDPRARRGLKLLLHGLPATKSLATHDLEMVVQLCSRALLLDEGRIVKDGPTVELLADEDLMLRHGLEKPHILLHEHPHG